MGGKERNGREQRRMNYSHVPSIRPSTEAKFILHICSSIPLRMCAFVCSRVKKRQFENKKFVPIRFSRFRICFLIFWEFDQNRLLFLFRQNLWTSVRNLWKYDLLVASTFVIRWSFDFVTRKKEEMPRYFGLNWKFYREMDTWNIFEGPKFLEGGAFACFGRINLYFLNPKKDTVFSSICVAIPMEGFLLDKKNKKKKKSKEKKGGK